MKFSRSYNDGFDDSRFDVEVSEVLVGTPNAAAGSIDEAIASILALLREKLGMNVAFVSGNMDEAAAGGTTVVLSADLRDTDQARRDGQTVPELLGKVSAVMGTSTDGEPPADGAGPARIAVTREGTVYGTLVCFGAGRGKAPSAQDLRNLRFAAGMMADKLNHAPHKPPPPVEDRPVSTTALEWQLLPVQRGRFERR